MKTWLQLVAVVGVLACGGVSETPPPSVEGNELRAGDSGTGKCFVGGCSGQVCSDREGLDSTCEWHERYACFRSARCERQDDGRCGWTLDATLAACLANN